MAIFVILAWYIPEDACTWRRLAGVYKAITASAAKLPDDIYDFDAPEAGRIALTGSGRLAGINGGMSLGVGGTAVTSRVYTWELKFPGGIQQIRGSAVPTFRLENDAQCPSGRRLTTTFELTLEVPSGKLTVTDTHCTANLIDALKPEFRGPNRDGGGQR